MSEKNEQEDIKELENYSTDEIENEDVTEVESVATDTQEENISEVDMLKQQIDELTAKVSEYENMARRAVAESDNIRKRAEKERREIIQFSNKNLIISMLGFMDNFERALANKPTDEKSALDFYTGIEMIHKQFMTFLADNGVEPMDEMNAEFDPNVHEAIGMEEDEKYEKETVIDVYSQGYKMNGEVLRAPKVRIGKPKPEASE